VTLQSCEDAQSGSNERIIRLPNPYHNLRLLQSSVSTSENLIQMTIVKPAVIANRREEKGREGKGSLVDALKSEAQLSFVK